MSYATTTHSPLSLSAPFSEATLRSLKIGRALKISGTLYTGRDRLHRYLHDGNPSPANLCNGAIFHCGPVVAATETGWRIVAAGPTTSMREEPYMARLIAEHKIRVIIGKGGMGAATVAACREHGCIYLQTVGGAAALIAATVTRVENVWFKQEFGTTEAMWQLTVDKLPGVVAIDTHGNSIYDSVKTSSQERLHELLSLAEGAD